MSSVNFYDGTEEKSVVVTECPVDQFLMVVAFQKTGGQSTTEKNFERFHVLCIEAYSV